MWQKLSKITTSTSKKDNAKELHTESYKAANLAKNISFQGLSENSRFSLAVYALKHFDSTQNNIYRKSNGMKIYRELDKHKSSNSLVDCKGLFSTQELLQPQLQGKKITAGSQTW